MNSIETIREAWRRYHAIAAERGAALDEITRLTRELAEARAALLAVAAQVSRRDGLRVDTAPSTIDAIRAAEKEEK